MKVMDIKIIGRDSTCDYVIIDPQNRVSRQHAELHQDHNHFAIRDLNSSNGTYINGKRIIPGNLIKIGLNDKITLSSDYALDLKMVFDIDDDFTKILPSSNQTDNANATIVFDNNNAIYRNNQQTVVFDRDKIEIGDIKQIDHSPFVTIGRNADNKVVINNSNISRYQCKIRMLTPIMIELEDLASTNGTFADEERLVPNKSCQFASCVKIRLGSSYELNLKSIFPNIQIIQKAAPQKENPLKSPPNPNAPLTKKELADFNELDAVWKEFISRQKQANNASTGYAIGGTVLGLAAAAFTGFTGGVGGLLLMSGGGVLGKYLGQQSSSKIRNDLTYEYAFLQTYACPRCQESFQKKPWITIRECYKCKIKFR
jgi:pSer/pThr/pTyr-binding forkhead associated (FHA) protein